MILGYARPGLPNAIRQKGSRKMALVKASEIYKEMDRKKASVIGFNCFNYESIAWAIEAAEEVGVPVLLCHYVGMYDRISPESFAEVTRIEAAKVKVPVCMHLDHGDTFENVMRAIHAGFLSVMIDCSAMSFDDNVKGVSDVVRVAHAMGVDVEAELGHVGQAANVEDYDDASAYTSPDDAKRFIELTRADSLAVAVGNAHGLYAKEPNLDMDLISRLDQSIDAPLVMHGGTGIPDDQLLEAFRRGVSKLNVGTEYFMQYREAFVKGAEGAKDALETQTNAKKILMEYLRAKLIFSQSGGVK